VKDVYYVATTYTANDNTSVASATVAAVGEENKFPALENNKLDS
jgi:hypothetical protein